MDRATIDLKKEQHATLKRPRYPYSVMARVFFLGMDLVTGKKVTLGKAKLLETLASVPYRAWVKRERAEMARRNRDAGLVEEAGLIAAWGQEADDNEYWHLLVAEEKMNVDGVRNPWYLHAPLPSLMVAVYAVIAWTMARVNIKRAFLFNAEFEDHAEHSYAEFVQEHPELETQAVSGGLVAGQGTFETWADVFRRIGLDERDHMNNSFVFCGMRNHVVKYEGMPELHHPGADS